MCFSAPASFVAGTALTAVGIATPRLASRPSQMPFAAIPLLFGIQQLIEGIIWLSFRDTSPLSNPPLTFAYSLFSHVLWPIYVPLAVRLVERVPWRRRALVATQVAGVVVGLYLLYFLVKFPVTSRVLGQHIVYESPHFYIAAVMALYLIATCASSLLASNRIIRLFGALSLATFLAAYAIHAATLVSVWCFWCATESERQRSADPPIVAASGTASPACGPHLHPWIWPEHRAHCSTPEPSAAGRRRGTKRGTAAM